MINLTPLNLNHNTKYSSIWPLNIRWGGCLIIVQKNPLSTRSTVQNIVDKSGMCIRNHLCQVAPCSCLETRRNYIDVFTGDIHLLIEALLLPYIHEKIHHLLPIETQRLAVKNIFLITTYHEGHRRNLPQNKVIIVGHMWMSSLLFY